MAAISGVKRSREDMLATAASPVRSPYLPSPVSPAVQATIQNFVLQLIFQDNHFDAGRYVGSRPELPGPLAATISRRSLSSVEAQDYWVCEKSDGERNMLLIVGDGKPGIPGGAYLINRSFQAFTFERSKEYVPMCAAEGVTLLDGELIQREDDGGSRTGKVVYMIFDAIYANGVQYGNSFFDARMKAIGEVIRRPFSKFEESLFARGQEGLPLYLMGKFFVPKHHIKTIFDNIHERPEHESATTVKLPPLESEMGKETEAPHRMYRNGARINGTDGIIFTPQKATYLDMFSSTSASPLLKWKFADENTVDYRLCMGDVAKPAQHPFFASSGVTYHLLPLYVYAGGGSGLRGTEAGLELRVAKCALTADECASYLKLMYRLSADSIIVECSYNARFSAWSVKRIRDRKTKANALNTAWQTLEIIAENISATELVEKLSNKPVGTAAS